MRPLRIVILLLEPPVPFGSADARWFYVLLRELVARGHRVTCFAACSKQSEIDEARRLFPSPDYDLRLYPFPTRGGFWTKFQTLRRPYSYMFSKELRRDLEAELARGFEVLHLEQLWCGWLGLAYRERALLSIHYLFSVDQADLPIHGIAARTRWWLTRRGERRLLQAYPRLVALSDRLRNEILRITDRANVSLCPLGIATKLYTYIPDEQRTRQPVISVIGNMSWYPTQSAAVRLLTRLWPEIKRRVPTAKAQLIGWDARSVLAPFLAMPDVLIEENVPDTRPYFERTGVLLYAPRRGSGMKVKVLEAFAFGVPVVTTSEGVEGLPARDGVHAGVCDEDGGLIERTIALLGDPVAQNRQRAAGRALLEAHCGPAPAVDAIERAYATLGPVTIGDDAMKGIERTAAGAKSADIPGAVN
jgi:polysaccharide biosynthesis protein PslH